MTLSLITITHNNPDLQKTLYSVKNQTIYKSRFEHIIVDNFSTDNTQEIINNYIKNSPYKITYIREKDTGRYNAMNKGIEIAKGDYLLFLNAGDCLHDKFVLAKVIPQLDNEIVYGDISGKSLSKYTIDKQFFIDRTLFHQATFIKKDLFTKFGLYDEKLVISSDFDFFIKAIIVNHATTKHLPLVITDYDQQGISSQKSDLVYQERALILARYFGGLNNYFKYFYYKNKYLFPKFFVNWQQQRLAAKPKI